MYKDQTLCQTTWGGAPSPMEPRELFVHPRKYAKSHSGPLQPTADHTPSRRCALAAFFVLPFLSFASCCSRRGLIWRSRCQPVLIQLEATSFCRRSASPSLPRSRAAQHARRQQKVVCGLRQVRSLRMLICARTTSISACQTMLFKCALPTPPRLIARPAAFAEHATDLSPVLSRSAV